MKKLLLLAFIAFTFSNTPVFSQTTLAQAIISYEEWQFVDAFPQPGLLRQMNQDSKRSNIIRLTGFIMTPQGEGSTVMVYIKQALPNGGERLVEIEARVESAPGDWGRIQQASPINPVKVPIHMIILTSGTVYGAHFTK